MKNIAINSIKFYRHILLPYLSFFWKGGCRFTPTCSEYSQNALEEYGFLKGIFLSVKRVIRCNPFYISGFDPVIKK